MSLGEICGKFSGIVHTFYRKTRSMKTSLTLSVLISKLKLSRWTAKALNFRFGTLLGRRDLRLSLLRITRVLMVSSSHTISLKEIRLPKSQSG